jgi:hypothetical protein
MRRTPLLKDVMRIGSPIAERSGATAPPSVTLFQVTAGLAACASDVYRAAFQMSTTHFHRPPGTRRHTVT